MHAHRHGDQDASKVFFLNGPGGSGKTYIYIYTFIIHRLKAFNRKVIPSAMTGIAAVLLPGGQTTHKTFCLPIPCVDNTTCRISPSSQYAEQLRTIFLFIIDEASMLSRYQFETIDRVMRDITGNNIPFDGRTFVLDGDFRQTLPVVRTASNTMIFENSIISSPLWSIVRRFRLTQNMRANQGEEDFKSFLLDTGDGRVAENVPARERRSQEAAVHCRKFWKPSKKFIAFRNISLYIYNNIHVFFFVTVMKVISSCVCVNSSFM